MFSCEGSPQMLASLGATIWFDIQEMDEQHYFCHLLMLAKWRDFLCGLDRRKARDLAPGQGKGTGHQTNFLALYHLSKPRTVPQITCCL